MHRPFPRWLALAPVLALLGFAAPARADDPTPEDKQARANMLEAEVMKAFAEKRYEDAEKTCREQIALVPKDEGPHYNLACALARQGKAEAAVAELKEAVALGFTDADHLEADSDLDSIREAKGYADVVKAAKEAQAKAIANSYEPPEDVKGVKTVEGAPENGLRWRLRIGTGATAKAPHRLIVWLHPSGGSMNAKIEPLATEFASKGWALLVTTQKKWDSWSESDAKRLLEGTLPDVAKVEGLDVKRPVLMGFSAGGQMALMLWAKEPGRFGGIVLDAAYPIDVAAYQQGRRAMMTLPTGDDVKRCPFFVVVGDADPGHMAWKASEGPWREAGIPLRVTYVPGGIHQWLIGSDEGAALLSWLADVAAGKTPASGPEPADAPPKPPDGAK